MVAQETQESTRAITEEGAHKLRNAAMLANNVAYGNMDAIGWEEVVLSPGERGVLPLKWNGKNLQDVSTHPGAPA
eukprot:5806849-Karenia_brevis.AAC.1